MGIVDYIINTSKCTMKRFSVITLVLLGVVLASVSARLSCRDGNGADVDWFSSIKTPNGYGYGTYHESSKKFIMDQGTLKDMSGPIGRTLQQVYQANNDQAYIVYNDESPDDKSHSSRAHMKGVLMADADSAFWMVHSVPRYPPFMKDGYSFPDFATRYGQSFLCITVTPETVNTIAKQMQIDWPYAYEQQLPSALEKTYPELLNLMNMKRGGKTETGIETITSKAGKSFTIFAKSDDWGKDLFEDLVAPKLDDHMQTETWQNGIGRMDSYCGQKYDYNVENVLTVNMSGEEWKESQDHSKWGISKSKKWSCVGDLNRQTGQRKRGGGTVCTEDASFHSAFTSMIQTVEDCK